MRNTTEMAYERDNFILQFLDCGCVSETECDISDYDDALEEYGFLLQNAINRGDKREIKQLRSEIQHCKAEKRIIKRMMKNRMEIALT